MFKKILCLVMFSFIALLLIQSIRYAVVDKVLFPIVNAQAEATHTPESLLRAAELKYYIGKSSETKEFLAQILKIPDIKKHTKVYNRAYLLLGHTFYEEYDFNNAFKAYYLLLRNDPKNKDALRKSVRILMATGKPEVALPLVNRYLKEKKEDPFALTERCAIYTRMGKLMEAGADCQTAVKARRGYTRALYDYAVVLNNIGFKKESEDYFRQAKLRDKFIKSREEIEADMLNAGKKDAQDEEGK